MHKLGSEKLAYIAGFLDGDGCIAINYEKRETCKLDYRVRVRVCFTQISTRRKVLDKLFSWIKSGTVDEYEHNNMAEYVIRDQQVVNHLLQKLLPFLIVKKEHAKLALKVLELKQEKYSVKSLNEMRQYAVSLRNLNHYPKRIHLDPVTTEA